ncbi:type I restriction endonuclease [Pseudodesulfovibrio sp.]|uniref:type I restriction endonuclease n=1 Tax=unclassified Pseudodesulfovibrio TaxID=2661612 RepID=UPI003AFFFE4D
MDFSAKVTELSNRVNELKDDLKTEEATKNALIQPFLQLLGYDPFDPRVVVPEFTSDIGTKQKEKVDYAIKQDGEPIMLFECKACGANLDSGKANQLHRYFQNTPTARVGVLTDGIIYEFYSDLDQPNIMDKKPFMIFDFSHVDETLIPELAKLASEVFNEDSTLSAAQNLKYTRQIKTHLAKELNEPGDEFVRLFASRIYTGRLMTNVIEEFRCRVAQAATDYINEKIDERLKNAMTRVGENIPPRPQQEEEEEVEETASKIITTEEEIEGYFIVKSILRETIAPERIFMRDKQSYCGIICDDNNRKPLCRLHFNTTQKYLGLFDAEKKEERKPLDSLNDIYKYANELKEIAARYLEA